MDMDTTNFTDLLSIVAAEAAAALPAPLSSSQSTAPLSSVQSAAPPPPSVTQPPQHQPHAAVIVNAQEVFSCTKCQQTFSGKGARQVHVRKTHQPKTILKHPNGLRIILERRPNGFFHCPEANCDYKTNDPWPVQAHYIRHFEGSVQSVRELAPARSPDTEERSVLFEDADDVDEEFCLADMGYFRNTKLNLIICKTCRICLQPRANLLFRHAKRMHNLKTITIPEIEKILESLDPFPCDERHELIRAYMQTGDQKQAPIAGLPVSCGWQCRICHQCCQKFTVMRKHFMMHHKGLNSKENSIPAFVQSLFGGKHLFYVAVDLKGKNLFPVPISTDKSLMTANSGGPAQPSFIDADHDLVPRSIADLPSACKTPSMVTNLGLSVPQVPGHSSTGYAKMPSLLGNMKTADAIGSLSQDFQISEDNLFLAPDLVDDGLAFRNAFPDDSLLDERLRLLVDSSRRFF